MHALVKHELTPILSEKDRSDERISAGFSLANS